jgi:FtsP/CotA-like multicopper oxidase with cupredoxin domain
MRRYQWIGAAVIVTLAACGRKPETADTPAADSAGKMTGMAMQSRQMMPAMRAHLDSMAAMPPDQLAAMLAAHQDMASRMMDAMAADMRGMNMQPDSAWTALSDSVRRDLADLPGLSGEARRTWIEAHIARMRRMMTMHQGMLKM